MESDSVAEITPVRRGDVIVVIPAHNEAERIEATVKAALTLAGVRDVILVDDGSSDQTAELAHRAGAHTSRLRRNRGKGWAMTHGFDVAFRYAPDCKYVLFLDADLGETAGNAGPLIEAVHSGGLAMAIAAPPPQPGGGYGFVVRKARSGIKRACGFDAEFPLSGQRCVTRDAFVSALPLGRRFGVEVGMTIDLVRGGYAVAEIPVELRHRVTGRDFGAQVHRAGQYRDVVLTLVGRRVHSVSRVRKSAVAWTQWRLRRRRESRRSR